MDTNEIEENTEATVENTRVTEAASSSGGVTKTTATVCGMVVAATCFIAAINNDFANQQAGMILSGITGGVFGVAVGKRL